MNYKKKILLLSLLAVFTKNYATIDYLDTTFGENCNGIINSNEGTTSQFNDIAFSNNNLYATGTTTINNIQYSFVKKYNLDGSINSNFGTNGFVKTLSGTTSNGNSIAVDANGKIVVVGLSVITSNKALIVRYNSDGSQDLTFGTGGIVNLTVGTTAVANSVAIDLNGKIVLAGTATVSGKISLFVARLNSNGTVDTTFGASGIKSLTAGPGYTGNSVKIDLGSKIVVGGSALTSTGSNFLIARFNLNGSNDNSFGSSGVTITTVAGSTTSVIRSLAIDASNRYLVGGYTGSSTSSNFTVGRYKINGTLDSTFGSSVNGLQINNFGSNSQANSIITDLNGQIVAAGFVDNQTLIARYNTNGSFDNTFGTNGIIKTTIGFTSKINSLALQLDGKVVSVGDSTETNAAQMQSVLTRFNKNNTDFINITSLTNNSNVNTKVPEIAGTSSAPNTQVQVFINNVLLKTITTDISGSWNANNLNLLSAGSNKIQVNLVSNNNTIVSQAIKINIIDTFGEDSMFAFNNNAQTSTSTIYNALPFTDTVKLGTWTYNNSSFKCNKTGTYLIEYVANAGLTGTVPVGTNSIDVSTAIGIDNIIYLGSESNATLDLSNQFTRTVSKSFVKNLLSGQTINLKFAVNIVGNSSGFNAGLVLSPTAIGLQPTYSLTISRIS